MVGIPLVIIQFQWKSLISDGQGLIVGLCYERILNMYDLEEGSSLYC